MRFRVGSVTGYQGFILVFKGSFSNSYGVGRFKEYPPKTFKLRSDGGS